MLDSNTLYARWLDGELSAEEIKSLKATGEWAELEDLIMITGELHLPAYDVKAAYEKLMSNKGTNAVVTEPEPHRIKLSTILSAIVSLLLLLGSLYFLKEEAPDATAKYGETISHYFPDNSRVVLNDGSSIAYDEDMWTVTRHVKLTGEAVFIVEEGSLFIVETSNGTIEALGASFNVRAWDSNLLVECYQGKVSVTANGKSTTLTKFQSVNVVEGAMGTTENISNEIPSWSTGTSSFKDENLSSVLDELERQYDIVVKRPSTPRKFTGTFTHANLDKALQQITTPMNLKYNTNKDSKRVIVSKY